MLWTVIWNRNVVRFFLLALMLMGLLLTPTHAFTTGMPASLVIGQADFTHNVSVASQTHFNAPVGLAFDSSGNLWVVDYDNNRVLMFKPPFSIGMAASLVIGQTNFNSGGSATTQTGLYDPSSLAFDSSGNLWVAELDNNRVLMFKPPFSIGMAASLVIGQTDFTHNGHATSRTELYYPYDLVFDASGNLWVSDDYNSRVLMFKPPFSIGMAASLVIGQTDFVSGGHATTQTGLYSPSGLGFDGSGDLWVVDSNNRRVLMFKPPFSTGMAASLVIGQINFNGGSANEGGSTSQTGLSGPRDLGFDGSGNLWVADQSNNRVLMFKAPFSIGMAASLVIGQPDFISSTPTTTQTGLNAPAGLGFDAVGNLWIADAVNARVLMFPGSTGLTGFLMELQVGWNLISLPIIPSQTAITALLKPLIQLNDLTIVWGYSATTKAWSFFTPPNTGTLKSMVDGQAYWLNMREAVNITIVGYVIPPGVVPPAYSLVTGWNLVGFKPQPTVRNETVSLYLASVSSKCSSVWVYNNLNQTWLRGTSDLELTPGEGMWLYMTQPATLLPQ